VKWVDIKWLMMNFLLGVIDASNAKESRATGLIKFVLTVFLNEKGKEVVSVFTIVIMTRIRVIITISIIIVRCVRRLTLVSLFAKNVLKNKFTLINLSKF